MAEARCRIPTRQRLHCPSQLWHARPPAAPSGIPWRGGRGRAGRLVPEGGGSADDREGGRGGACVTACIKRKFLQSGLVFLFVLLLVYIYNKEN